MRGEPMPSQLERPAHYGLFDRSASRTIKVETAPTSRTVPRTPRVAYGVLKPRSRSILGVALAPRSRPPRYRMNIKHAAGPPMTHRAHDEWKSGLRGTDVCRKVDGRST